MRVARSIAVVAAAVVAVGLAACSSNDRPAAQSTPILPSATQSQAQPVASTTSSAPGVYAPMDTGKSRSGLEASILAVDDANTRYGPGTVITFQVVNTTGAVWEGYNWSTPSVVYGPAGTPAETITSLSEGYGAGVQGSIPPGSRQTVKHAYKVSKAELTPAVVTAGSVIWQGDFSTFKR
ncbi:hypothetical protein [Nocardia miyunensis]|uniref:hypothetical protein n=1 Tax=Nocardia miyunensis TaxID=282684 RepID=UPI000A4A9EB8|nr:hypothetical protein [Nocardia miyunensis]